jgi:hypothetical protein
VHDNAHDRADEQQEPHRRLDEEPGQAFLHSLAIADEVQNAAADPGKPEFRGAWRANDVRSHGEGVKHLKHPVLGPIAFEYSAFAVDGRPDLSMVVYNPATIAEAEKIRSLLGSTPARERA